MTFRRICHLTTLVATLLAFAAQSTRVHASTVVPRQVVAHTALAAVRATVIGYYTPGYNHLTCSTQSPRLVGAWSTCPFTARYRRQVQTHGGVDLCPEQYGPRTVTLRTLRSTPWTARINAHWDMGRTLSYTTTFVVVRAKDSWLISDEYLAGRPSTSVYNNLTRAICP